MVIKLKEIRKITTYDVLKIIAAGGIIVTTAVVPPLPMILVEGYKAWRGVKRKDLGRIARRLEKQELISVGEKDGKVSIQITEKGKRKLLKYDYENMTLKTRRRDGKWRLIIFDIPEHFKKNRDAFRRKLVQIGCVRLQDSVFVSAFPCKDEVDFLVNFLEISDFVTIAALEKIERGEQLVFEPYKYGDEDAL